MDIQSKRRLSRFLKVAEPLLDALALTAISLFFLHYPPLTALSPNPATGGDTGSHFWPLVTLFEHSLPELKLHVWNPGNLGGEPQLVHYFPFPYFVMAFLGIFMPLGTAFNIGSLLPLLTFPIAVYTGIRLFGWRFPIPILAACASLSFLYNESFSMWGGNTLSTMAGQFAHLYALNFLMVALGCFARDLRLLRFPLISAILFAAVNLSHAYVMLGLPLFFMAFLLLSDRRLLKDKILIAFTCGVFAILLSAWFVIPMINNSKWTIPHSFQWYSPNLVKEVIPSIFFPILAIGAFSIVVLYFLEQRKKSRINLYKATFLWMVPTLGYFGYYFLFPYLGLVDVRAFPQCELFVCILAAILFGSLLRKSRVVAFLTFMPLVCAAIIWASVNSKNFPFWVKWNYSGWVTKPAYKDLVPLYDYLRGDFSMPRVIYEQSMGNGKAGTERVFEMLPYFANRATFESVYLQATILAPAAFLLQAEISKAPSCPFNQFECAPYNLLAVKDKLKLLGVGQLILVSPEILHLASENDYLQEEAKFAEWHVFRTKEQPSLVDFFNRPPLLSTNGYWKGKYNKKSTPEQSKQGIDRVDVEPSDWKDLFYYWLKNYDPNEPMVVVDRGDHIPAVKELSENSVSQPSVWEGASIAECAPELKVEFNRMHLKTKCPGKAHYLKFAYHSTWKTDTGDIPFLVSPGFIGLIPSKGEVTLTFGVSNLWRAAGAISILALIGIFVLARRFKGKKFQLELAKSL